MKTWAKLTASIVFFFLLGELLCYTYYFHKNSRVNFGWEKAFHKFNYLASRESLRFQLPSDGVGKEIIWKKFFTEGGDYMKFVQKEFDNKFHQLLTLANSFEAKLLLVYIPQTGPDSFYNCSEKPSKDYFRMLAQKYQTPFLDLSDELAKHKYEHTTLYPGDNHLSRFGNYLVAERISAYLSEFQLVPSIHRDPESGYPEDLGHFGAYSGSYATAHYRGAAYEVLINNIGIRGVQDLETPKKSYRVACLGDSFTFGHGVLNEHTYPHLLENLRGDCEFLNFGIPGTTITSHLDILKKLDKLGLDLIILEFGDSDLIDLMTHRQEIFSRIKPSERPAEEYEFLKRIGKI